MNVQFYKNFLPSIWNSFCRSCHINSRLFNILDQQFLRWASHEILPVFFEVIFAAGGLCRLLAVDTTSRLDFCWPVVFFYQITDTTPSRPSYWHVNFWKKTCINLTSFWYWNDDILTKFYMQLYKKYLPANNLGNGTSILLISSLLKAKRSEFLKINFSALSAQRAM